MRQPKDSSWIVFKPGFDCLLSKSHYGARKAGMIWGNEIHNQLIKCRFVQCSVDPRLNYFCYKGAFLIVCVVFDEIAFEPNNPTMMNEFEENIGDSFNVKFYGKLQLFIRWTITRTPPAYHINQQNYCEHLFLLFGIQNCNPALTPLPQNVDLSTRHIHEITLNPDAHTYRFIFGGISFLAHCTRPDLLFSISALARSLHAPSARHLSLKKRVFLYINTSHYGIKFNRKQEIIPSSMRAALETDCSGCTQTRRSISRYILAVNEYPIFWKSKLRTVVVLSSGGTEYVSLYSFVKDISWLHRMIFVMFHIKPCKDESQISPTSIEIESSAAMYIE